MGGHRRRYYAQLNESLANQGKGPTVKRTNRISTRIQLKSYWSKMIKIPSFIESPLSLGSFIYII